jgi:hypothetical protein
MDVRDAVQFGFCNHVEFPGRASLPERWYRVLFTIPVEWSQRFSLRSSCGHSGQPPRMRYSATSAGWSFSLPALPLLSAEATRALRHEPRTQSCVNALLALRSC